MEVMFEHLIYERGLGCEFAESWMVWVRIKADQVGAFTNVSLPGESDKSVVAMLPVDRMGLSRMSPFAKMGWLVWRGYFDRDDVAVGERGVWC